MRYYVGLDISLDKTHICVVDEDGTVVNRAVTPTHPDQVAAHLLGLGLAFARVGFESMAMASWMYEGLARASLPAIRARPARIAGSARQMGLHPFPLMIL